MGWQLSGNIVYKKEVLTSDGNLQMKGEKLSKLDLFTVGICAWTTLAKVYGGTISKLNKNEI